MEKEELKVVAPEDLEAHKNETEQAIANSTNNAGDEPAVDSEAEAHAEAESRDDTLFINQKKSKQMEEDNKNAAIGNNEQANKQPQEAAQVNNPTEASTMSEPILKKQIIYSSEDLKSRSVKLAYLKVNRGINDAAVKKKIKSISLAKGIITPSMVVPAKICLNEGLEVKMKDGTPITNETPSLDHIYVIIDGQHRQDAVEKIAENASDGEEKYTNFFFIPLANQVKVSDLLRESNVATYPWKDQQYLSNLIMMKEGNTTVNLEFLKEVLAHPEAKTKAMVRWLSLDKGRNLYSRNIIAAYSDDEKLKEIADVNEQRFKGGKRLYVLLAKMFASNEPGKTVYAEWVIDRFNDETSASFDEMLNYLEQFFDGFTSTQIIELKNLKGSREPYESRDSKVQAMLTKYYNAYKAKHPIKSSK